MVAVAATPSMPTATRKNRPYQVAALDAFRASTLPRGLLCLATGLGKTYVAAQLPDVLRARRVLVLAHREELVQQLARDFEIAGSVGIEKAERFALGTERVIVASTATLVVSPQRLERLQPDSFDLVIRDEAHHALADSEMKLWRRLGFVDGAGAKTPTPRARLVGLTATPGRSDGEALRDLFDGIVFSMSLPDGIRAGYLVPIRAFTVETTAVLDDVGVRGGEYVLGALADAVDTDARNATVFDACERHAAGLRTLAFGVTVKHAANMAAFFRERGRQAHVVHGEMGADERRQAFAWFASTPGAVLTNCQLVDEGTDLPGIECVVMAAPTRSAIRYAQRVGRGTRVAAGAHDIKASIAAGKSECVVLDVTDSTENVARRAFNIADLFGLPKRKRRLVGEDVLEELDRQEEEERVRDEEERRQHEAQRVRTASRAFDLFAAASDAKEKLPSSSRMMWTFNAGVFSLGLPGKERVRVRDDALGGWWAEHYNGTTWRQLNQTALVGEQAYQRCVLRVEAWVRDRLTERELAAVMRDARWRSDPPSEKQIEVARKCRIPVPEGTTRGDLSAAIDAFFARARRRR
jgi:superfamily II DNA or RNA helicase